MMPKVIVLLVVIAGGRVWGDPTPSGTDSHPYSVSASVSERLGVSTQFPRLAATIARRSWDRLHVALRAGVGGTTTTLYAEQTVEAGLWLYPSRSVSLLLGWRVGHAYIRDTHDDVTVKVHALLVETFAEVGMPIGPVQLRIAPMIITGYRAGLWELAIGPEIGVAKWF